MENYTPVAPNPPPRPLQENDAPLGSSSARPAHSYERSLQFRQRYHDTINQLPTPATTWKDEVGSEQTFADFPTASQQAALTALQDYDNGTIFAWLTGLRAFRPGGEHWFQPDCLSPWQLEAISALKDCTDNLISAWLDSIRCGGSSSALPDPYGSSQFPVQKAAIPSTRNTWQGSANTSRSSSSSFGPPVSRYASGTSSSTQRSSWSRGTFLDLSREPSIDETAATRHVVGAHTHWCFVCEIPRVFTTCDGWKRHMKEHETRYPCMPQGREIYTAHGTVCVLCGAVNPDEGHYSLHKILPCFSKPLIARSYIRKSHLISHLKTHGISDGSRLAEEWRDTLDKKYFSCGFCIACFHSLMEQLNHIDNTHYKNHQLISEWDPNKTILGLLLQPQVQESWQEVLTAHPQYTGFHWSPAAVKRLKLRLEKSEETANDLALAAFNESTYGWTQNTQVGSMPVLDLSHQNMNIHQNMSILQPQATPSQLLFALNQSSGYDGGMMNTPLQAQYPAWRSIATNHLGSGIPNANPTAYQNNSSHKLMMTDRPHNFRDVPLDPPSSNHDGWVPPQSPSHAPLSVPSDAYGGQKAISSRPAADGKWQASSLPKPLAGHSGHLHNSSTGRSRTTAATQPTSLGFNFPASPFNQAASFLRRNGPSSLPTRMTKKPSSTKLKDHYGIDTEVDMDIDLDDIQYLMREEEHTRSERRRR